MGLVESAHAQSFLPLFLPSNHEQTGRKQLTHTLRRRKRRRRGNSSVCRSSTGICSGAPTRSTFFLFICLSFVCLFTFVSAQ